MTALASDFLEALMERIRRIYRENVPESIRQIVHRHLKQRRKKRPVRRSPRIQRAINLEAIGDYEGALELYAAMGGVDGLRGRTRCLFEMGRFPEAAKQLRDIRSYEKELLPVLYAMGSIESAHRSYRRRRTSYLIAQEFDQPVSPVDLCIRTDHKHKSALVIAEGGPGDEIRFAAIYDDLASCFESITVTCDPRLHSLMVRSFPDICFLPVQRFRSEEMTQQAPLDRDMVPTQMRTFINDAALSHSTDMVFSTFDALGEFRRRRSDFIRMPHIQADPARVAEMKALIEPRSKPQIGICWRSMRQDALRNRHYFTVEELTPLTALDADFWLLQIGATDDELQRLRSFMTIRSVHGLDLKDDFEGQAALMANLDAVISPLTNTAEMSGSLGVRTLIASPERSTSWRRNHDGSDVWYSCARTFTSESAGGRKAIISAIASELLAKP